MRGHGVLGVLSCWLAAAVLHLVPTVPSWVCTRSCWAHRLAQPLRHRVAGIELQAVLLGAGYCSAGQAEMLDCPAVAFGPAVPVVVSPLLLLLCLCIFAGAFADSHGVLAAAAA